MTTRKVDASRHNAKAAPKNNPSSVSNGAPPPFFDGGGGSTSRRYEPDLVGKPPPIKKELGDFCPPGRCSSLWNTHHDKVALKLHLGYMFKVNWRMVSKILYDYGVDHINQTIHDTETFISDQIARGQEIGSLAACFIHCLQGARDAEPGLSPEAAADRDVTVARDLAAMKPKKRKDDPDKYLKQFIPPNKGANHAS